MAAIGITDLTTGALDGTGVFDKLMVATKAHLNQEFDKGRIRGSDFATVYLGAMTVVLQQAVAFLLSEQTAEQQADKIAAEIALLTQKKLTEQAQILDTVDGNAVVGVIGKQKTLFQAQTDGFARDAEQKLMKMCVDTWAVRRTTDDATVVTSTGLTDQDIQDTVDKARAGVGLAASVP